MKAYRGLPRLVVHALASADRPLLAHLVVTRRCNLSCAYCNEYDHKSAPVPFEGLADRISRLASLRTAMVACTGGEPLLHPRLGDVVREIRSVLDRYPFFLSFSFMDDDFFLTNLELRCADVAGWLDGFRLLVERGRSARPALVVLDPPRSGARAALAALLRILPERIIYVSCDPATLTRDLGALSGAYRLVEAHMFDLFPQTSHVETVVCLQRSG